MFDSYDAIEDWLEKHFKTDFKVLNMKIDTLALCDICKEYRPTNVSNLMKRYGSIMLLCDECMYDYKIKIDKYIKEEEEWKKY